MRTWTRNKSFEKFPISVLDLENSNFLRNWFQYQESFQNVFVRSDRLKRSSNEHHFENGSKQNRFYLISVEINSPNFQISILESKRKKNRKRDGSADGGAVQTKPRPSYDSYCISHIYDSSSSILGFIIDVSAINSVIVIINLSFVQFIIELVVNSVVFSSELLIQWIV